MARQWNKDEILDAIQRMSVLEDRKPKWEDFAPPVRKSFPPISSICKAFGSWSEALKAAGFEPRQMPFRTGPFKKETRQKMSEARMGWKPSEKTRKRMSLSAKKRAQRDGIWSKGLTKDDHPTLERMSQEISGENNPMYGHFGDLNPMFGRKHSKETRKKISVCRLGELNPMFGKKHPSETIAKMSASKIGEKNPAWQGGIAKNPYPPNFRRSLKGQIRKRDNSTCQLCLRPGKSVHHIDYEKSNLYPQNLITLCRSCNSRINTNRRFWQACLTELQVFRFAQASG